MDSKSLGALIRKKRNEKHMTQTQLADLLHVSANAVSKWELEKNSFDLQNLNTLANVLDIPLDQLSCRGLKRLRRPSPCRNLLPP